MPLEISSNKETVKKFIQSVLVIDDKLDFQPITAPSPTSITTPGDFEINTTPNQTEQTGGIRQETILNANKLIKSFAEDGIACAPYRWTESDSQEAPPSLCHQVDIPIIDWHLESGDEVNATQLLRTIIEYENSAEFKFIVIYTDDKQDAKGKIEDLNFKNLSSIAANASDNEFEFNYSSGSGQHTVCQIIILPKTISEDQLKDAVVNAFTQFNNGFLPNAALSALTSIRQRTFDILSLYPKHLDKAALSHYTALISSPKSHDQAEQCLTDFIADCLASDIKDSLVHSEIFQNSLNKSSIKTALKGRRNSWDKDNKLMKINPSILSSDSHDDFFEQLKKRNKASNNVMKKFKGHSYIRLEKYEQKLSEFSCLVSTYKRELFSKKPHPLKFGTVIKNQENEEYFICIQPLCDGLRLSISDPTVFPFIKLERTNSGKVIKHLFHIKENNEYVSLAVDSKPHHRLRTIEFLANEATTDVRTVDRIFKSVDDNFLWLSEIKTEHVQHLIHQLSTKTTRIGMDQYEWIRHLTE